MAGNQRAKNDAVRTSLANEGDDGAAERTITHYAYPLAGADPARRPAMIVALRSQGFAVRDAASAHGLVMEHKGAVAPEDFDAFTEQLEDWFRALGWDYDGWECAVVRSLN